MKEMNNGEDLLLKLVDNSITSVYVADYETDELQYINETGKKVLNISGDMSCEGTCYKVLMNRDTPCPFCHKDLFSLDAFIENMITFPFNGRQYRISSKLMELDERLVHVHYITDETGLLNEQKALRTLTDNIPAGIGIFSVYPDGRFEPSYINDGYYTMIGSSREKRTVYGGFSVEGAIHPKDLQGLKEELVRGVKNNNQVSYEFRVIKDNGEYMWVCIRADIIKKTNEKAILYCAYSDIDQLKKTQGALEKNRESLQEAYDQVKKSEQSLSTMVEHIPGAMIVFEVKNEILYLNYISDSCEKISGFTAKETYERHRDNPLYDMHPDSKQSFKNKEIQDLKKGGKLSYKYQIRCKDGSYKWVSLNLSPVENDGKTLYYGVFRDVNEEETTYIEKESKFQQIVALMNEFDDRDLIAKGRYDIDENKILYYKRKAEDSLDLDPNITFDDALEAIATTAVSKQKSDEIRKLLNRDKLAAEYKKGNKDGDIEYQRMEENGSSYWSLLKYSLCENPESHTLIFFVYTYDITERVLQNKMIGKLGTTEYDVLGLIDVKSHQFESKTVRGIVSLAGSGSRYIKGDFAEVIHSQIVATVMESEREELMKQLSIDTVIAKLEEMDTYYISFSAVRGRNEYRRKKMNFTYLDDSKTSIFYFCNDITDIYNREQEQLHKTEEALEAAKVASESKTEFFSRMSHDMRTPMNGILGIAELSEDENNPEILKDNISKIKASGEYLLGLINDTLDFQRIESGKMVLEPEIVNGNDLIRNVMDMVRTAIQRKKIDFRVHNINVVTDWYVKIDPVRIKQIFVNLLSNAIKFTPEGGTIFVKYECLRREGMISHDKFTIRDTGIGMSKEFMENKIFKPFSQEHNNVTGLYAGSGLGLSIVKNLVELMGGTISVESELGVGSKFTVCVDFERVDEIEFAKAKANEDRRQKNISRNLVGKRILLAEDHPLNAEIAGKLLERVGCTVDYAVNGQECIDKLCSLDSTGYDVILMDVRMPVMDGITACEKIRALDNERLRTIPVIAMTANAYKEDVAKCLEAGMNAHLTKPIQPRIMYEEIARIFL